MASSLFYIMSDLKTLAVTSSDGKDAPSRWVSWLYDAHIPAFYMGSTLLLLSMSGTVPARMGWLGFAFALPAAILSHRLKRPAKVEPRGYVILNVHLLSSKGGAYHNAIDRFRDGDALIYDGIEFVCCSKNEVVCRVAADRTSLDESAAFEIAAHAQFVFTSLRNISAEFDSAVNARVVRTLIMSGYGATAFELCRLTNGNLKWRNNEN